MTIYAPGTQERDPQKQNMALQAHAAQIDTNTSGIATNTANIATNTSNIATNTTNIATNTSNISTLQTKTTGYEAAWTTFTPTFQSAGGTLTTASASGRYKQIGKTVFFSITGTITTNGTGSSWLQFSPPVTPLSTGNFSFNSYNVTDNILLMGRFLAGSTYIDVFKTDGTYPGASGKTYIVSGQYEAN